MSENTVETTAPSAEELKAMWDTVPAPMQQVITETNEKIDAHNLNVSLIKASQGDESKKLLFELRDQNPKEDAELKTFTDRITKLNEQIEKLTAQANERAQVVYADQLKTPTPEEVEKARESVTKSGQEVRAAVKATSEFSKLMGLDLALFFNDIQSLKGTGAKRSSRGENIWRPRWSAIYANDELIQAEVKNPKTGVMEAKSTINILVAELNKRTNSKHFSVTDVQQACITAGGGDKDNLPEEIVFPLSYEVNGETVTFNVKCVK